MAQAPMTLPMAPKFGETSRRDRWWVQPLAVFLGFSAFIIYSTWAAFQGKHYHLETGGANYLSPFYSPEIFGNSPHSWFGPMPGWVPGLVTPAFFILWAPVGFRFTCYYYRGAYYKAFWADPPNCAVGEPRKSYWGENTWPLLIQNIHRYFLIFALMLIVFLSWDAVQGFRFRSADGHFRFGIGIGSLVLTINAILLGAYTLGCHSFRHLIGGRRDELSKSPALKRMYDCSSCLNRKHMLWAWCSLVWVGFSDLYVRLCSMGIWTDLRII